MNGNKDDTEPTIKDESPFGKLSEDLLIEIFIRVPITKWDQISCVRKQWANLFRGECLWQAALNRLYPLASKTKRWTGPIRQGLSKRRYVALYISRNILGVETDIDEMLGHIYLFLKDQLQLSTTPASGILHGTLIDQLIVSGKSKEEADELTTKIWLALLDNLEDTKHTFIVLKSIAQEYDGFLPYPYSRPIKMQWKVFEKLFVDFRDLLDHPEYCDLIGIAKKKFQTVPYICYPLFFFFEMVLTKVLLILVLCISVSSTLTQSNDGGHISILVSKTGLEFAKDFLINRVISTTVPLQLPDIEKKVRIPLIGKVRMGLSNIQIDSVDVHSSKIETGKDGIFLSVSGATANLSMDWSYTYRASFFEISDHGDAFVKVKGIDVKTTVTLLDDNGGLKVASRESDCTVENIDIHINGGASWLYQGVVDAFEKTIISTVENTVSKKILEKMKELDSFLQSLPKERKIDDSAAVNLTFTGNPVLGNSSVEVAISGLFMPKGDGVKVSGSPSSSFFREVNKMVTISIEEEVFNSATLVYFNAKVMHLVIGETKNGSILSTSDWKLILPELYKHYPDEKMMLNMSVTSPPAVNITENGIDATIQLDIAIDVQDSGKVLSVARISSVMNVACSAEIVNENLTGSLRLNDFNATMTWSKIGEFQSNYVQAATSRVLEALFLPYVNTRLKRGFPLPIPSEFTVKDIEIAYANSAILVGTNIGTSTSTNHY
ncbi:PREDICTED: putative BPI/LBP family protein At3g20270 [Camelina sativa]|uniref:BPI/LBP family protein At3g20270 n=1 Tax=Camelina sativa TaxID=90675 RepID=A0ABM1Q790_CAMSA|nr:PREDICTED: putative BPI/LBP family protein At3g20270 [Camelina sativa]